MKIKHTYRLLIKLSGTHLFTDKGTYVQKQKRILKLDHRHCKSDQDFSIAYQKQNKNTKTISASFKNPNFG
jgi:hypothetical protein